MNAVEAIEAFMQCKKGPAQSYDGEFGTYHLCESPYHVHVYYADHCQFAQDIAERVTPVIEGKFRAGESDEPRQEGMLLTPGQWIKIFNDSDEGKRLRMAERAIRDAEAYMRCNMMHYGIVEELNAAHQYIASLEGELRDVNIWNTVLRNE